MLQNNGKVSHEGVISKKEANSVFVSIVQQSACAGCHAKGACTLADKKERLIEINDASDNYRIGETVSISCSSSMGLSAVFYAFVIPLIITLTTLVAAEEISGSESVAAISSVLFLTLYFFVLYLLKDRFKKKFTFRIEG